MLGVEGVIRRRILLPRDAVTAHTLPRLCDLRQNVLPRNVACPQDPGPNGKVCPIAPEPSSCARYHCGHDRPARALSLSLPLSLSLSLSLMDQCLRGMGLQSMTR